MNLRTLSLLIFVTGCNLQLSSDQGVFKLSGSSSRDVWAIAGERFGGRTRVIHYDGGDWSLAKKFDGADLTAIRAYSANDVWVAGHGALYHFDGSSWSSMDITPTIIAFGDGFAVGDHGAVLARQGGQWIMITASSSMTVDAAWGASATDLWGVTSGNVQHFDGHAWEVAPPELPTNLQLSAIWGSSASDIWAAGYGAVAHYDGQHWTSMTVAPQESIVAIWGTSSGDVFASGYNDLLLRNWTPMAHGSEGSRVELDDIWGTSANDIWVVGYQQLEPGGKPILRHFDGTNWTSLGAP